MKLSTRKNNQYDSDIHLLIQGIIMKVRRLLFLVRAMRSLCRLFGSYIFAIIDSYLRIHWRPSKILGTSNKSIWSNAFWYVKGCIFWKCIQCTAHWDKTQIFKKFPSHEINGTKNALFFLLRTPTHHSFTFNLRLSYELEHKVRLSKTVLTFSIFDFVSLLLKFIFLFNKMH